MIYIILYIILYITLYSVIPAGCIQKISVFKKLANRQKSGIFACSKNTLN